MSDEACAGRSVRRGPGTHGPTRSTRVCWARARLRYTIAVSLGCSAPARLLPLPLRPATSEWRMFAWVALACAEQRGSGAEEDLEGAEAPGRDLVLT